MPIIKSALSIIALCAVVACSSGSRPPPSGGPIGVNPCEDVCWTNPDAQKARELGCDCSGPIP